MSSINKKVFILGFLLIFGVSAIFAQKAPNSLLKGGNQKKSVPAGINADKRSYTKGETVALRGSGFRQYEAVTVRVEQFDELLQQDVLRGTWTAFADFNGEFISTWEVNVPGRFTVTGIGSKSGRAVETVVNAAVTPVVVSGNPSCADLNASSDPRFAYITSNFGFKIEPPTSGTRTFTNGAGRELTGGAPSDPNSTLTITIQNSTTFDWLATRAITAVIVKGGSNANVYPYDPFSFGDTGLTTAENFAISHIEVCFGSSVTTAARVPVSGRVTDAYGKGLARTIVTIQNTETSETRTVLTNPFGYYRFDDLEVGNSYIISARNKRYTFETETQVFSLNDAVDNLNFIASEQ
jgi:hypothetical protein